MSIDTLSPKDKQRYQRHIQLPGFAEKGQEKLQAAKVLLVGLGGLGCPASQYLAAAGVGQLTLVDGDQVSLSNLQRQPLYTEQDIGKSKAQTAAARLGALNQDISIDVVAQYLSLDIAESLIAQHDIVIDCTDNFHTRYLINDICIYLGKPWVFASVLGFSGQLACFPPGKSCFRCIFPEVADVPDCNQAGVLGVVPGVVGVMQALEAIKYLCDLDKSGQHCLYLFSALSAEFRPIRLSQSPNCKVCRAEENFNDRLADYQAPTASCLSAEYLVEAQDFEAFCRQQCVQLVDVRSPQEHEQFNLGGINKPVEQWQQDNDIDHKTPYLFYCQSGARSAALVKALLDKNVGLEKPLNIKSLQGGINALKIGE